MFDEEGFNVDIELYEENHESLWKHFREEQHKFEESKKALSKMGKDLFTRETIRIFKNYPRVISFGWTQYTPYFMDGDPCVFYANTDYFYVNGWDSEIDECTRWFDQKEVGDNLFKECGKEDRTWDRDKNAWKVSQNKKYNPKSEEAIDAISNLLTALSEEDFLNFFGDHALVAVTKDGLTVHDWEHD